MSDQTIGTTLAAVESKGKQRDQKRLGGASGHGFLPGRSGNPGGRPRTIGLLDAIREKVLEVDQDGHTVAQRIAAMLVDESLRGKHCVAAASLILDRLEGKPPQQLHINNITRDLARRSDAELEFYLKHSRWPEAAELAALQRTDNGVM